MLVQHNWGPLVNAGPLGASLGLSCRAEPRLVEKVDPWKAQGHSVMKRCCHGYGYPIVLPGLDDALKPWWCLEISVACVSLCSEVKGVFEG